MTYRQGYRTKCQVEHPRFAIGQRVERYEDNCSIRVGTVVDVYAQLGTSLGDYNELYDVQWDGTDGTHHAYLKHGIQPHTEVKP